MFFARLWAQLRAYLTYRHNRAILDTLSDHDLADIGLQRGEIDRVARLAAHA